MHDKPTQVHWHEPKAGESAGYGKFKRQPLPYDRFMESEGVPIYRGIGVRRVQDLPRKPWKRMGGWDRRVGTVGVNPTARFRRCALQGVRRSPVGITLV